MMKSTICFLAGALGTIALSGCAPQKPPAPPPPKVTVVQPQMAIVTNWDEYPGHLEAVETVEVRARVVGYIDSIHFQDGAEVKKGDLLFVIDPRPYQTDLNRTQAQRQQAETRLELAQNDLKRAEGLRGTKAISEEEYDSRSKAVREAEAGLAAAKASETTARLNLEYTEVKAPINGKIGRRLVTTGNFVQLQGGGGPATVLATIVSQQPIYCYFDAQEEAYLGYCKNGSSTTSMACELGLVREAGFPHKGHVDFVDNQVDPKTGTIRLRGVFANKDRALVPGLFANVRVPAGEPVQALLVPEVAIGSDQGRKFVYLVNKENIVETRSVQTGRLHGPLRSVLAGLAIQDRVVVNGLMMVRPGAKVEVESSEPKIQSPETELPNSKVQTHEGKSVESKS
jgi:multidrug efflux system membrane fusion protein